MPILSDAEYYLQKAQEMRELASLSSDPEAKREFERLAEEYVALADRAQPQP